MDPANVEMVIFDVGGSGFGTEVSRILSILKPREGKREEDGPLPPLPASLLGSPNARENLESVQLVDLSMHLGAREDRKAAEPENLSSGCPALWLSECAPRGDGSADMSCRAATVLLVDTTAGTKGVQVESVRGIVKMSLEQIEPLPEFLKSRMQTDCIWGIGKLEEELLILLDLDRYILDFRF